MSVSKIACLSFSILMLCLFTGCNEVTHQVKASAAPDSGFLKEPEKMTEQRDRYPFNRVWISPEYKENRDTYKNIIIAPVNTAHLLQMEWWQKQSAVTKESLEKDAAEIAGYAHEKFQEAVLEDKNHRFNITTKPAPHTVTLEVAIIELVPNKAFFNAATTVGGFFVPGLGYATAVGKGSVAIEGRLRDSSTGKVLAQMADREEGKSAIIDIAGMTWYDSSKDSIDDWADQFVELSNTDFSTKVSDSSPFTLVTW